MAEGRFKRFVWKYGLALLVLFAGLAATGYVYRARLDQKALHQTRLFNDTARQYQFLLQRRLDIYASSNRNLAAFFSASGEVTPTEFSRFLRFARFFERMEGASSFGYLPKVRADGVARFEASIASTYPGFRVRGMRPGANYVFPLLYGENAGNPGRVEALRGLDYSSIPERYEAMQAAAWLDGPAATESHPVAGDMEKRPQAVLVFTPIRKAGSPPSSAVEPEAVLDGFVFSVVRVDELFETFDNGVLSQLFDVEVFDGRASRSTVLYTPDGTVHALAAAPGGAYVAELQFANRRWNAHFLPKGLSPTVRSAPDDWIVLAVGLLLSVAAAQATLSLGRYSARRRVGDELSARFDAFFQNHPAAVYSLDTSRRFLRANRKLAQELGVRSEDLVGQAADRFVAGENRAMFVSRFEETLAGNVVAYHNVIVDARGGRSDVSVVLIPVRNRDRVSQVLGFAENITERKRTESQLSESRQMLQFILDNVPQKIFWKDRQSRFLGANRRILEDAGVDSVDQLVGKTDYDFPWKAAADRYRQDDEEIMRSGVPRLKIEEALYTVDGERWLETSKVPLRDASGNVVGILGVAEDITDRKRMEQELFRRANYDSLTGLPNRAFFYTQLQQAMQRSTRHHSALALMYFDIDRFKQVNDQHGHGIGDAVIQAFAARVRAMVRGMDSMARLGGDEFVLVVEELGTQEAAQELADKLVRAIAAPFEIGELTLTVSTSIGIAFYEPNMSADMLVRAADRAMYDAKHAGRSRWSIAQPQSPGPA